MIVLDASVALPWLMDDEEAQALSSLDRAIGGEVLLVPPHWWAEVANALLIAVRKQRTDLEKASGLLDSLTQFKLTTQSASAALYLDSIRSAEEFRLTVYDAAYLVLSQQHELALATTDKQFRQAAISSRVSIIT